MNSATSDPFTTYLLSGLVSPSSGERDHLHEAIAAETVALPNPVAWREIRTRLVETGVRKQQLSAECEAVWSRRKRLRMEVKTSPTVGKAYQRDKRACECK